jgi:sucrose phosphorylase
MNPMTNNLTPRLAAIYGPAHAPAIAAEIAALVGRYAGRVAPKPSGWSERDALLITYADSILGDAPPLAVLNRFLQRHVGDLITFVHLLPFYPFTSDDGFAVSDFRAVRPELGTWADIAALAARRRLVFDAVINHVSASSAYVRGYCNGAPALRDFLIALDPATDTSAVLRTRNLPLLHEYATHEGPKWLWTTFSRDQLDLNFANPRVLLEILDVLLGYAARGAAMLRLDAIPYLWKQLGTSCAHLPQTHELIKLIRDMLDAVAPHVQLLTETNVPHRENITYFGDRGDEAQMIYNFALPPLILWSLVSGDASVLTDWARQLQYIGPRATYLNITATHDGIGMRPTEGLLDETARARLVQLARDHHGDVTGKRNADGSISPYELNLNYFDAVNHPDSPEPLDVQIRRFVVSQAIPMALMGIPGLYIHSLLGSRSDRDGVKHTGRARSINRAQLDEATLIAELADCRTLRWQVFRALTRLLAIRRVQPAFSPDAAQEILDLGASLFAVRREAAAGQIIVALHNVSDGLVAFPAALSRPARWRDLLAESDAPDAARPLEPYAVRWLTAK